MKSIQITLAALLLLLVAACNATKLAQNENGGIGGTGISTGRISNFGSIFVNGVEYDVDSADFTRNDLLESNQQSYRIGEYVVVEGDVNPDGVTGKASKVNFSRSLQGNVTTVSSDGTTLAVMGQPVRSNVLTVFYGFNNIRDLTTTDKVEVSGVQNALGEWIATSIRKLTQSGEDWEVKGTIQHLDSSNQTFAVGGLTVAYGNAALHDLPNDRPEVGQFIRARSQQALVGMRMDASEVRLTSPTPTLSVGTKIRLEGVITRFTTSTNFAVNGLDAITTSGTRFEEGTANDLSLNALLEMEGTVAADGVIMANNVKVKESASISISLIQGAVSDIDSSTQQLTLGEGTTATIIVVDSATLWEDKTDIPVSPMNFNALNNGNYLQAQVKRGNDGQWLALRVTRTEPPPVTNTFSGLVNSVELTSQQFIIGEGTTATTLLVDAATTWLDSTALAISPMSLNHLNTGNSLTVQAQQRSDGKWLALNVTRTNIGTPP